MNSGVNSPGVYGDLNEVIIEREILVSLDFKGAGAFFI
jgi:hypothetical protein